MNFMEWNPQTRGFLSQCFLDTLSPDSEPRRRAVKNLSAFDDKPNYGLSVLRLVAEPAVDGRIRELAAFNFKNHVKARWKPSSGIPISDDEKKQIRLLIVSLLHAENWESTPKMKSELKKAILMIAKLDHVLIEANVPQLRSSLKKAIKVNDFTSVNGTLTTLNMLCEQFRYPDKCDGSISDLNDYLDNFAALLLTTVKTASVKISAASARSTPTILQLIQTQRLCCRIYFSFSYLVLPDVFVYNVDKWMNEFKKYLTVRYPCVEDGVVDGVAIMDELRLAVLGNITLCMAKYEKLFQKYLSGFVEAVLSLLVESSAFPNRGRMNMVAIMFLYLVSTSVHHALFASDDILQKIIESIVIPNVMVRDEDEELFEKNYVEFITREMEMSGAANRGRIACDLLRGIARNYKEKVTQMVSEQIHNCLALFDENPTANWKYKYCAIYLVIYLASLSADIVELDSFFLSFIVPELLDEDVNAFPMLKAGALKFFTIIWLQITKPADMELLDGVVRLLASNVNVVHSYAAIFLDKFLVAKDLEEQARFTAVDIDPILPVIMKNLFCALEKPKSEENKYIMTCIMRVLQIADISSEVASSCITCLTTVLNRVCENPKTHVFNHCLFEAVATLVKRVCEKNPSLVHTFESWIIPILQVIQARELFEFFPYAFQLYAQLVDFNQPPFSPHYLNLFDMILKLEQLPSTYLPDLIRLLQSFIKQAPDELNKEGRLRLVLDKFKKLVSSPNKVEQGFYILHPLIENLEYDGLTELMNYIWPSVFTRLQKSRTPMLVKCLIIFLSLFLVKHGIQTLVDSVNSVQANLFRVILGEFWIPNLQTVTGSTDVKLCTVAATKLLCKSPLLLNPAAKELWGKLLNGIVTLLSQPEEKRVEDEPAVLYIGGEIGSWPTFVPLLSDGKKEEEPLKGINDLKCYLGGEPEALRFLRGNGKRATCVPLLSVCIKKEDSLTEIKDPKHYSVALLANLSSRFPGRFPPVIIRYLSSANQASLVQLCNSYNLTIV